MILTKGLPCYACRPGRDWADFQGLLARGDVGLTIYRYRSPPEVNRTSRAPRETFILYTTRNINADLHRQINLDLCEADMPKCVNYCPRCKEMMRRIEALFSGRSTVRRSDLCEMFSCPPCTDIVRKFRNFAIDTSIREHDSELIHLQRFTAPEYDLELKIRSIFNKAGLLETAGGLKDTGVNIICKNECFQSKDGRLKDKEGINKDKRITFKDIDRSLKDGEGINKDGEKNLKDKDEGVKYRESTSKDSKEPALGAARLTEDLEGLTQGREAKTSKASNIKETTGKEKERHGAQGKETEKLKTINLKDTTEKTKGRQDIEGRETETTNTINLKDTTGKSKGTHDTQGRQSDTSKTNVLKETTGKAKGRQDTQGREVEMSKTINSKDTAWRAKGRQDTQGREVEMSKTNSSKSKARKAKEEQETQGKNVETSKTFNSKGTTRNSKGTEAESSKRKEYDEIKKGVKLRKSIDEGSRVTKTKDDKKPAFGNITKEESKIGKISGIQNSDSRIMATKLAASKSDKGLSSNNKTVAKLGGTNNRGLEISGLMRMKIDKHMRELTPEKEGKGTNVGDKIREAQKAAAVERQAIANCEKARQLSVDETLQLLAAGDEESVDRSTDISECAQNVEAEAIIRGNRIYKISKREATKQEVEPAIQLRPVKSWRPPDVRPLSLDKTKIPSSASIRDGVLRYSLSESKYINRGWTILPKEMIMRKVLVFLMRPARQNYDWLEINKHHKLLVYPSGEPLATFDEDRTRLYYRSGEVALEFYKAEDANGDRVVVYSAGKPAAGRARPRTVLAVFDYSGNGAVYDHAGQVRLKYSQSEGVVIDRTIGPHTHWKWHNLDDSQLLHTVLIEKLPPKDLTILEYEDEDETKSKKPIPDDARMRGIEMEKIINRTKMFKKYTPFQIKMKAVKINEYFSLKIFEQPSIFLSYSDGKTHLKINVGMVLDPRVVVGEDLVEAGEVFGGMEGKLAYSESVERLQRVVQGARAAERARVQQERRLNITPSYLFQRHQKQSS